MRETNETNKPVTVVVEMMIVEVVVVVGVVEGTAEEEMRWRSEVR